jgi:aquaporin Z
MKQAFKQHWKLYLMEAFGLAIFMISACFFAGFFESTGSFANKALASDTRQILNGILMGATALFIFYSPFTSPSGAHINPAVTITFLRLGKISKNDAFFYILFQFLGGTIAVYIMAFLMRDMLTAPPVSYAVTIPGKYGVLPALITEFTIAFIMITMVLFTSSNNTLKKYTRIIAGCFVSLYVIFAGPVSGFGMNPARTFASAFPAHTYTAFWIYLFVPIAGMLAAAEFYLFYKRFITSNRMSLTGMHMYHPHKIKSNV